MKTFFARIPRRTWIIAAVAALLLLLGAGGAYAYAQSGGSPGGLSFAGMLHRGHATPNGQAGAHGRKARGVLRRLIARSESGSIKVKDASAPGGYVTIAFAKGALTSVNTATGQISIKLPDGATQSYTVPTTARIRAGKAQATLDDLRQSQMVVVITKQQQGGSPTVIAILARPAASSAPGSPTPASS